MVDYCSNAPDYIGKTYVGDICKIHDADYAKGGTKLDREEADVKFFKMLRERTNLFIAFFYYIGVRLFGGKHFGNSSAD